MNRPSYVVPFMIFTVSSLISAMMVDAWSLSSTTSSKYSSPSSRRQWFQQQQQFTAAAFLVASVTLSPTPALAATPPTPQELAKLQKGHARIQYLLENWDAETQVCGKLVMSDSERKQVVRTEGAGSAGCEKTPLNVQAFLGYKSTEDPLIERINSWSRRHLWWIRTTLNYI